MTCKYNEITPVEAFEKIFNGEKVYAEPCQDCGMVQVESIDSTGRIYIYGYDECRFAHRTTLYVREELPPDTVSYKVTFMYNGRHSHDVVFNTTGWDDLCRKLTEGFYAKENIVKIKIIQNEEN